MRMPCLCNYRRVLVKVITTFIYSTAVYALSDRIKKLNNFLRLLRRAFRVVTPCGYLRLEIQFLTYVSKVRAGKPVPNVLYI